MSSLAAAKRCCSLPQSISLQKLALRLRVRVSYEIKVVGAIYSYGLLLFLNVCSFVCVSYKCCFVITTLIDYTAPNHSLALLIRSALLAPTLIHLDDGERRTNDFFVSSAVRVVEVGDCMSACDSLSRCSSLVDAVVGVQGILLSLHQQIAFEAT